MLFHKRTSILTLFLTCNIFGLLFNSLLHNSSPSSPTTENRLLTVTNNELTKSFLDPTQAYHILSKLDIYEGFGNYTPADRRPWSEDFNPYHLGLTQDDKYCEKHRAHFVNNPEDIFQQMKFMTDLYPHDLMRQSVISVIGSDIMSIGPHIHKELKKSQIFDLRPDINIYYCNVLYLARKIGSQFSCTTQMSNHIPGHHYVYRKDLTSEALVEYGKSYESKPDCFNYDNFFPRTWVLYKEDQCKEFFNEFNSLKYQQLKNERNIVYIRKVGAFSHQGHGVEPVNDNEEQTLRSMYKNGDLCGKVTRNYIIQYFVHNPLLLEGHKFDFRIYMLIASTNPLIAFYHDGFLRVSLHEYTSQGNEKGMFITNTALSKSLFSLARANGTFNGMTEEELKDFQMWLFDDLQNYLFETGAINDKSWLDNYLRPGFKKAMIHLLRMGQSSFLKTSSVYELMGMDFMLDSNLNIWFIEANTYPSLAGGFPKKRNFMINMLKDHFEVISGLLKSRVKRIINYVNELIIQNRLQGSSSSSEADIGDLEERIKEFRNVSKNYFEPEYQPRPENGWSKIIDENYEGTKRYSGLLNEKCLQ